MLAPSARPASAAPDLPAFPGAEGFGAAATGGRGGDVVLVDTLEPFGPGSLAEALDPDDDWESEQGLDPTDGEDHATVMASGYTAIEEYVNELSDALVGAPPPEATVIPEPAESGAVPSSTSPGGGGEPGDGTDGAAVPLAIAAGVVSVVALAVSGYTLSVVRRHGRPPPP